MAIVERLQRLLDRVDARYDVITYPTAFTAQQIAHNAHVTGRRFAKVLVMRDEAAKDFLVVLPAYRQFDANAVREATGRTGLRLENEVELQRLFPDCELGAMPPFGHLYSMPMWVDRCLAREPEIFFEAGNHHELIHMRWSDYAKLAAPFGAENCLHEQMVGARG
jgi:Ala-tRNA(Pro) deacylase